MEKLLRKDTKFQWNNDCQHGLDTLKEKMVTMPILVFPDWEKTFHVHVDASSIALGAILAQPGARDLDHPIEFASRNLSESEHNYNTTEREGLAMVYTLQKFRHYLLGKHFKMFTYVPTHQVLVSTMYSTCTSTKIPHQFHHPNMICSSKINLVYMITFLQTFL
jgi:hypothetical protein